MKDALRDTHVAVHIDYSENYSCKYSCEIKETHSGGGNQQVTLHTGLLYLSRRRVLKDIRQKYPDANNLHFISDSPTSQYRYKTLFCLASSVPFLHGFQWITWNFRALAWKRCLRPCWWEIKKSGRQNCIIWNQHSRCRLSVRPAEKQFVCVLIQGVRGEN